MVTRKGLGKGKGKGYRNMIPKDPKVHSDAGRGVKQPYSQSTRLKAIPKKKMPTLEVFRTGTDYFGRPVYSDNRGNTFKEVEGVMHKVTREGEPDSPVRRNIKKKKPSVNKNYERYILNAIEKEDGTKVQGSPQEKLTFLKRKFESEKKEEIKKFGKRQAFKSWLMGLPTYYDIPFENYKILNFAKKMGSLPENPTQKQEDKVLNNYWNFMTEKTFQTFRKYGVEM